MLFPSVIQAIALLAVVFTVLGDDSSSNYFSAVCNGKRGPKACSLVKGKSVAGSHGYGYYQDDVLTSGWGKLWIHGDETLQGSYEGGFVEGALTTTRIYQHYTSWYTKTFGSVGPTESTMKFIRDNYNFICTICNMSLVNFTELLMEAAGDLYDIIPATNPALNKLQIGKLSAAEFEDEWHKVVSCSAIVKIAADKSDCWFGHTTWTAYSNMLRICKNYDMIGGKYQVSFSAKPGSLYSKDDFYILPREDQRLGVMETTNGVLNAELYKLVVPETLLTWTRMPIANAMATTGKAWTEIFSLLQSGTYCNQYMVIDMKRFTPGVGADNKDFLWIVEVIPGSAAASDVSQVVLNLGGYWPSYNVPYTPSIYVTSGYQKAYETYGDSYSYTNCSRAQMMRRDQGSINSIEDTGAELRQNNYLTDPLSAGDPALAISSRKDLRTTSGSLMGGIDSKVSSYSRLGKAGSKLRGTSLAQSGPTHDSLAPFSWSNPGPSITSVDVHLGQPDTFNFPFVEMDFFAH